jgi:hypothetical protein
LSISGWYGIGVCRVSVVELEDTESEDGEGDNEERSSKSEEVNEDVVLDMRCESEEVDSHIVLAVQ